MSRSSEQHEQQQQVLQQSMHDQSTLQQQSQHYQQQRDNNNGSSDNNNSSSNNNANNNNDNKPKRNPFCSRCRGHGKSAQVKGHKRHCEYKDCKCDGCELVHMRQLVSAAQIKRRRYQKQDEECGRKIEVSGPVLAREPAPDRDPLAASMTLISSPANHLQDHHALLQMQRNQVKQEQLAGVMQRPGHFRGNNSGGLTPTTTPTLLHPLMDHHLNLQQHRHHHFINQAAATSQIPSPRPAAMADHHLKINSTLNHLHQAQPGTSQFHLNNHLSHHQQRLAAVGSPLHIQPPVGQQTSAATTGAISSQSVTPVGHNNNNHHHHNHHQQQHQQPATNQALSNALQLLQFPNSVIHTALSAAGVAAGGGLPASAVGGLHSTPAGVNVAQAFHNQHHQNQSHHHHLLTDSSTESRGGDRSAAASTGPGPTGGNGGPSRSSATTAEYSPTDTNSPMPQLAPRDQISLVEEIYDTCGPLAIYAWFRAEQFDLQKIRDTIELSRAPFDDLLQITGHSPLDLTSPIVDV